jgi:hypothetical protein
MLDGEFAQPPFPRVEIPQQAAVYTGEQQQIIANKIFEEKLKIYTRLQHEYEVKYNEMFALIWNYLSVESQLKVQEHANWRAMESEQNMKFLRQRIVDTHQTGEERISPVAKKIARDRLHNCKQNHTESIAEFKRRFDDALAMYNHTGCEEIDEATIAVDFLYQLDSQRFTSLRVELENDINSGLRTMPATLADAYHLASTYKVTASSGKAVLATAFVTRKEQTKKETKNVDSPIKEKKTERSKSSSPPKPCKHCGGDHWNAKCPNKPKFFFFFLNLALVSYNIASMTWQTNAGPASAGIVIQTTQNGYPMPLRGKFSPTTRRL